MIKDVLKYLEPNACVPIDMATTIMLVNALKERLADPMREVQRLGQEIEQERNFCPRCGKRTPDLITIHTCTPPKD